MRRTRQNSPNMLYPLLYFSQQTLQGLSWLGVGGGRRMPRRRRKSPGSWTAKCSRLQIMPNMLPPVACMGNICHLIHEDAGARLESNLESLTEYPDTDDLL